MGSQVIDTVPPDAATDPERIDAVVAAEAERKPARLLPAASGRLPPDATDTTLPGSVVTAKPPRSRAEATAKLPPLPTTTLPVPSARGTLAVSVPEAMVVPPVKFPDPLSSSVPAPVFTSEPVPVRPVGSVSTAAASVTAMPPTPPRVNVPARDAVAPS